MHTEHPTFGAAPEVIRAIRPLAPDTENGPVTPAPSYRTERGSATHRVRRG